MTELVLRGDPSIVPSYQLVGVGCQTRVGVKATWTGCFSAALTGNILRGVRFRSRRAAGNVRLRGPRGLLGIVAERSEDKQRALDTNEESRGRHGMPRRPRDCLL